MWVSPGAALLPSQRTLCSPRPSLLGRGGRFSQRGSLLHVKRTPDCWRHTGTSRHGYIYCSRPPVEASCKQRGTCRETENTGESKHWMVVQATRSRRLERPLWTVSAMRRPRVTLHAGAVLLNFYTSPEHLSTSPAL